MLAWRIQMKSMHLWMHAMIKKYILTKQLKSDNFSWVKLELVLIQPEVKTWTNGGTNEESRGCSRGRSQERGCGLSVPQQWAGHESVQKSGDEGQKVAWEGGACARQIPNSHELQTHPSGKENILSRCNCKMGEKPAAFYWPRLDCSHSVMEIRSKD